MKAKLLFLILFLLGPLVMAQQITVTSQVGVNQFTKEQCEFALEKANNSIVAGKVMTFSGVASSLIGIILYSNAINDTYNSTDLDFNDEMRKATMASVLMYGGLLSTGIGIPIWITANGKKTQLEIALKKFNTSYITTPGIGIRITF